MKYYLILISTILVFSGCALIPPHAVNLDIKGHNLETSYGKIEDGEIHVHTMWGNKNQCIVSPLEKNTSTGASTNTSIPVTVTVTPGK